MPGAYRSATNAYQDGFLIINLFSMSASLIYNVIEISEYYMPCGGVFICGSRMHYYFGGNWFRYCMEAVSPRASTAALALANVSAVLSSGVWSFSDMRIAILNRVF